MATILYFQRLIRSLQIFFLNHTGSVSCQKMFIPSVSHVKPCIALALFYLICFVSGTTELVPHLEHFKTKPCAEDCHIFLCEGTTSNLLERPNGRAIQLKSFGTQWSGFFCRNRQISNVTLGEHWLRSDSQLHLSPPFRNIDQLD